MAAQASFHHAPNRSICLCCFRGQEDSLVSRLVTLWYIQLQSLSLFVGDYSWFSADVISLCKLSFLHVGAHAKCEIVLWREMRADFDAKWI